MQTKHSKTAPKMGGGLNQLDMFTSASAPECAPPVPAPTPAHANGFYMDKYRNPANKAETWSGKGRCPAWVYPHLKGREIPGKLLNPNPVKFVAKKGGAA